MTSAYRISTITCVGGLGTKVDLAHLFECMRLVDPEGDEPGFVCIEAHGRFRGVHPRRDLGAKSFATTFDNQVTCVYRMAPNSYINTKVFRNGQLQFTGVKDEPAGEEIIRRVADEVRRIAEAGSAPADFVDISALRPGGFRIAMVNSDVRFPFEIRRRVLYHILVERYGVVATYQGSYPAVKIAFCWNADRAAQDGICRCSRRCFGKGTGSGDGQCKRVTIACFQSGSILVTGGNTMRQIEDAHRFIRTVIECHEKDIRLQLPPPGPASPPASPLATAASPSPSPLAAA